MNNSKEQQEMKDAQLKELLVLSRWDHLDSLAQEEAANSIASWLPEPFRFAGLETHELGQHRHRIAIFTWHKERFALIPGGSATLGYTPGSFRPTEAQQASWEETCREYPEMAQESSTLEDYLEQNLTALRQVILQPFLLEVAAQELDSQHRESYSNYPSLTFPVSSRQIQKYLIQDGFRLPTSDEWEYACAAGARTLWRWGDETPMILMASRIYRTDWQLHLQPNAFGLLIGDEPANWEFTAEEGVMRGGDGGTAGHVGPGRFVEWLTLASSYWIQLDTQFPIYRVSIRRSYSLFG